MRVLLRPITLKSNQFIAVQETEVDMETSVGRIQKQVIIQAPIARVWDAISDSQQFGRWFGARIHGPFEAGARVRAEMSQTEVDPEVAASQAPYEGVSFDMVVDRMEPPHLFAFRWHPGAEPDEAAGDEAMTLVRFELDEVAEGTRLTIQETGFDRISAERRARDFADNEGGWEAQAQLIRKYVERA